MKNKLASPFKELLNVETRPKEGEFTIVFAVISDTSGDGLYLPFFSRVNLNNAARTLRGYGFNVETLKIHYDNEYSKTTILPAKKRK